ncbi:helix-turn-helix transcriptional regulator [Sulfurimonas sp.]|uniref:helix-turn-helix domain-containing protein n=1 Tax=Sulfurimonas sp. TaxID=2022749 RepID=UPI002637418F|nr:helix-turn-helix transcriptional regulator [Sulfurimonas sp.]MDD3450468.1 helix-turn-helix transcriptional regulator [Sulfurimonas sp.]
MSSIGERLEKIRTSLAMTGKSFAEILEITPQGYINYSKNKRDIPIPIVLKINQMFNISFDWLLTGRGEMLQDNIEKNKISISNKINSHISEKEIEIWEDYRTLDKDEQEIFYHELKIAAIKAKKKAKETNGILSEDAKSAV